MLVWRSIYSVYYLKCSCTCVTQVFGTSTTQLQVFETVSEVVDSVMKGFNGTGEALSNNFIVEKSSETCEC